MAFPAVSPSLDVSVLTSPGMLSSPPVSVLFSSFPVSRTSSREFSLLSTSMYLKSSLRIPSLFIVSLPPASSFVLSLLDDVDDVSLFELYAGFV